MKKVCRRDRKKLRRERTKFHEDFRECIKTNLLSSEDFTRTWLHEARNCKNYISDTQCLLNVLRFGTVYGEL